MTDQDETLRILNLRASNFLRLKAVDITPGGGIVTLGGGNGEGKTSILNAIQVALGGKKAMPERPIHEGEERSEIVADLGKYVVTRTITTKSDKLTVKSPDGAAHARPQDILNGLFNRVSFDPMQFAGEKDTKKQAAILRDLLGLDFSDLDQRRDSAFSRRTDVNRDGKRLKAQLDAMPPMHADTPADEVSMADAVADLDAARANVATASELARIQKLETANVRAAEERVTSLRAQLEAAECELADAKSEQHESTVALSQCRDADTLAAAEEQARDALANIEETNRRVRQNRDRTHAGVELETLRAESANLTTELDDIESERRARLEAAEFPVRGLGFDESGVTFKGLPFSQASAAEKMRVSVAVGIAMNPRLRVLLVRDGSLLDSKSLKILHKLAAEHECQIWLEDARTTDPAAVIIEDGTVAGAADAAE